MCERRYPKMYNVKTESEVSLSQSHATGLHEGAGNDRLMSRNVVEVYCDGADL